MKKSHILVEKYIPFTLLQKKCIQNTFRKIIVYFFIILGFG